MNSKKPLVYPIALTLALGAAHAQAVIPVPPEVPLLQATGAQRLCYRISSSSPGCDELVFDNTDVWVFRDGRVLAITANEDSGSGPHQLLPRPLSVQVQQGVLSPDAFSALRAALAAAQIGTATGNCDPIPPPPANPLIPPQRDLHYRIVWYGKALRTNVVELGTEFPDICPAPVEYLFSVLRGLPSTIAPGPLQP